MRKVYPILKQTLMTDEVVNKQYLLNKASKSRITIQPENVSYRCLSLVGQTNN